MTTEARIGQIERTQRDLLATVRQLQTKRDKPSEQVYPSRRAGSTTTNITNETAIPACALTSVVKQSWGSDNVADDIEWNTTPVYSSAEGFTAGASGITVDEAGTYECICTVFARSAGGDTSLLAWLTIDGAAQTVKAKLSLADALTVGGEAYGGFTITSTLVLAAGEEVGASMAQQGAVAMTDIAAGECQISLKRLDP